MIVLTKKMEKYPGVKEMYKVIRFNSDKNFFVVEVNYARYSINEQGIINIQNFHQPITDQPGTGRKIVDPKWNENAKPAKPKGFKLDDPETWDGLMWEDIPLIDDPGNQYFKMIQEAKVNSQYGPIEAVEEAILKVLQAMNKIPGAEEGWQLERIFD